MGTKIAMVAWSLLALAAATGFWHMVLAREDAFAAFLCAVVVWVASCEAGKNLRKWWYTR